jgi:hypothetical protein
MTTQAVTRQHDAAVGQRLRNISIALVIVATALWLYMWLYGVLSGIFFVFAVCFVASYRLCRFLVFRGKQYLARSKPAVSLNDPRPPVVLLRSFQSDALYSALYGQVRQHITTAVPRAGFTDVFWWDLVLGNLPTFEEFIAKSLHPIGPLVALGRPEEAFPPPGAARFHETDQSWKNRVVDLLRRARVVILIPGASQALNWETMTAFRELKPRQLVILGVGTDTPHQYKALARIFKEATGRRLPHPRRLGAGEQTAITFDEGWVPRILRLGGWRSVCARLHNGLEPVFRANGIKWHPLPRSMKEVIALPCAAVVCAIPAYELILRFGSAGAGLLGFILAGVGLLCWRPWRQKTA